MSLEENKACVRRFIGAFAQSDLDAIVAEVTPDFIDHDPPGGVPIRLEGMKEFARMMFTAFSAIENRVEDLIAEGDKVTIRFTVNATHRGPYLGIAATGRRVSWQIIDIFRLKEGKIAERWGQGNVLGLLKQLGAQIISA